MNATIYETMVLMKLEKCLPPPYEWLVWNYKIANITAIRKVLDLVNWDFVFLNKTVHNQVLVFDQALMNIFTMYPTNTYFDDPDPLSTNGCIKSKIQQKNFLFQKSI